MVAVAVGAILTIGGGCVKPTKEQLKRFRLAIISGTALPHAEMIEDKDGPYVRCSPELLAALELAEAVAWMEANGHYASLHHDKYGLTWYAHALTRGGVGSEDVGAKSLPAAVAALRAKMGEEVR